jgi:hypothetical protein
MSTEEVTTGSSGELQRLLQIAQERLAHAVSAGTSVKYERVFRDVWEPLCKEMDVPPLGAPPKTLPALLEAARSGALRRPGKGNKRTGMMSPGYLDTVLAAVRHKHVLQGLTSPLDAYTATELAAWRRAYRSAYRSQREPATPQVVMTLEHFQALCRTPAFLTRQDGAMSAVAVLSLDADASLDELLALEDHHFSGDDGSRRLLVALSDRVVTFECRHDVAQDIVPACGYCLLTQFLALPGTGISQPDTFAGHVLGQYGQTDRRQWLYILLRRAAMASPGLSLQVINGRTHLRYAPDASPRLRTGARQLLAVAGTRQAKGRLMAKTALKLAAGRGLTAADLFDRLTWADVDMSPKLDESSDSIALRLVVTERTRSQDRGWLRVKAQGDPEVCPVRALHEWLLVQEAAAGERPSADRSVFVGSAGWRDGSAATLSMGAGRLQFMKLLDASGLPEANYSWKSGWKLLAATLVEQGASETQLYRTLRVRKPEQLQARLAELPGATGGDVPRDVVARSGGDIR